MNTKAISSAEISDMKVSSLPTRPTAPGSFGGRGYTAKDMKEAFDRLPLYIIERINSLIADISAEGEGSLVSEIPTGIAEAPRLSDILGDVKSGELASYLSIGAETLGARMQRLAENEARIDTVLELLIAHAEDTVLDGGTPSRRAPTDGEVIV